MEKTSNAGVGQAALSGRYLRVGTTSVKYSGGSTLLVFDLRVHTKTKEQCLASKRFRDVPRCFYANVDNATSVQRSAMKRGARRATR